MISSTGSRGDTYSAASRSKDGSGSAFRSSLSLLFRGNSSITTTAAGTMYEGSDPAACAATDSPVTSAGATT
ncbi:hypothetical protein GCM10009855_08300 [Gordonia cholesterolivorans]|uniref:Uncharacterized protein n=1 Tax=Gordonia cholesterolivorans TaxID=559625 RepID=A0ABN3H7A2_9ACTN